MSFGLKKLLDVGRRESVKDKGKGERSGTATQASVNAMMKELSLGDKEEVKPKEPIAKSGVLTIRVIEADGLEPPRGTSLPDNKQLPYIVVEFDKNEVAIDAIGGSVSKPMYMHTSHFDVSRIGEVSLSAFLRTQMRASQETCDDVFMGGVQFTPYFDSQILDTWIPSATAGKFHIQVVFKPVQTKLTIDSFELLKVIGKGSFGKVMQVRKKDTQRIYALKTIRKAHIVSRSEVTHTLAERTVLSRVNSPFIVPLKFSFQSAEKLYLVLAFVNGGELFHHLQREGRFSEARSRFYAAELLCALEHLHKFDVVYRDLKPENILIDYVGHIALCDFGLCKLDMTADKRTNTFCGTPEYLAPEILLERGYNKAVDWWTLGVLLYEMLSGLPPFYSEDTMVMYERIVHDPLKFTKEIAPDARDLLTGLLTRDADKRLGMRGAQDIKKHPFFVKHIDWSALLAKRIQPPWKPSVASASDTSNFDSEFTSIPPQDSVVEDSHLSETVQAQFQGFSYQQPPGGAFSVQ